MDLFLELTVLVLEVLEQIRNASPTLLEMFIQSEDKIIHTRKDYGLVVITKDFDRMLGSIFYFQCITQQYEN